MRALLALLLLLAGLGHAFAQVSTGNGYPVGATPVVGTNTGGAGATNITLPASATQRTWLCGFLVTSDATAATTGAAYVLGTIATINFRMTTAALANGTGVTSYTFSPCIPGSAINTALVLTTSAAGSGGNQAGTMWGYQY
jgi:hypothetical protein